MFQPKIRINSIYSQTIVRILNNPYEDQINKFKVKVFSKFSVHINGKECAFINCPANCQLSILNGCPHNCNCDFLDEAADNSTITGNTTISSGKHRSRCPKAICPQPFPKCLTLTGLDGCQKCTCEGKEKPPVGNNVLV